MKKSHQIGAGKQKKGAKEIRTGTDTRNELKVSHPVFGGKEEIKKEGPKKGGAQGKRLRKKGENTTRRRNLGTET